MRYKYRGYLIDDDAYGIVAVYQNDEQLGLYPTVYEAKETIDYWVDGSSR